MLIRQFVNALHSIKLNISVKLEKDQVKLNQWLFVLSRLGCTFALRLNTNPPFFLRLNVDIPHFLYIVLRTKFCPTKLKTYQVSIEIQFFIYQHSVLTPQPVYLYEILQP